MYPFGKELKLETVIKQKFHESFLSILPIAIIVLCLGISITPLSTSTFMLFLLGVLCLIAGLAVFTMGAEMSMQPLGTKIGSFLGKAKHIWIIAFLSFIIGILVTISEPDFAAEIDGTKYATLEDALAAAVDGDTIVLLADATPALTSQRLITKASVIDLNGKTLTLTEDDLYFGSIKFQNGKIVVDPSVKASTAVFWMFENQTLTFDQVSNALMAISRMSKEHSKKLRALVQKYGASKLSEIAPEHYEAILAEAEVIGNAG